MNTRSKLSQKMLLPVLFILTVGLLSVLVVYHLNSRIVIQLELTKRLQREVQLTAKLVDSWLQARINDIAIWSQQEVFRDALTEEGYYGRSAQTGARELLTTLQNGYSYYESIFLADLTGKIITYATNNVTWDKTINIADRPYFRQTLKGTGVISQVVTSRLTGNSIFVMTSPIYLDRKVIGIIGGVVDFNAFKKLFFEDFKLKQHGYATLSTSDCFLASSRNNEKELSSAKYGELLQHIASSDQGTLIHNIDNHQMLTVFQHLPKTGWSLNIIQSLDDTLQPLQRIIQVSCLGALLILAIIFSIVLYIFRRLVSERLRRMLTTIGSITAGDLSLRLPISTRLADEITDLTEAFNTMIDRLDHTLKDLNEEIEMRKETEVMLANHQENLETIIAQRSLALKKEVADRQKAEEKLIRAEKLEMIGTLAGGVAHDLNNILSGIVSYPDLLLLKLTPDNPLYQPLTTIKNSGEKAVAIVDDLLTLARRSAVVKEPVNLNDLIRKYLASPEFEIMKNRHADIQIISECAEDLKNILGSPVHLGKTIMNLVANGLESMTNSGTLLIRTGNCYIDNSLRLYEKVTQGEYVTIEIADQGSGIRPEDIDKIFEPFYTTKKMGKSGTGLGMAVVWGTVKDHNGYINCESKVGTGTTFTLFFPVTALVYKHQLQTATLSSYKGRGEKILVVDDVEEQREITSSILRELNYRVTTVATGEEALRLAAKENFDMVLLDMILGPGMDGLDIYRGLLHFQPKQKAIITSGFSRTERIAEALRLGVGQYLKKPYAIEKLGVAILKELQQTPVTTERGMDQK